jgi:hypothetical protein
MIWEEEVVCYKKISHPCEGSEASSVNYVEGSWGGGLYIKS